MGLERFDWSVIIVGRWNQAILTPAGIAKHVFKLQDPIVEVAVPIDGISPYQVKKPNSEILVMTEINRLRIQLLKMDYDTLQEAMNMGINALKSLPETPVTAAGFNIKFRSADQTPEQINLVRNNIDDMLSDESYNICERTVTRSLEYTSGRLNLGVAMDTKGFVVSYNFHRGSSNYKDLVDWLKTPIEEIKKIISEVSQSLKLNIEEINDGHDEN